MKYRTKEQVVYSKPPFAGPRSVLSYLARYTHRIAISNSRLLSLRDGRVTFRWRDRANGDRVRTMTLDAEEFLRRYLLQVVPGGFMRLRHYGLWANASHKESLARCRALLDVKPVAIEPDRPDETWQALLERVTGSDPSRCPRCKAGELRLCETLPAVQRASRDPPKDSRP